MALVIALPLWSTTCPASSSVGASSNNSGSSVPSSRLTVIFVESNPGASTVNSSVPPNSAAVTNWPDLDRKRIARGSRATRPRPRAAFGTSMSSVNSVTALPVAVAWTSPLMARPASSTTSTSIEDGTSTAWIARAKPRWRTRMLPAVGVSPVGHGRKKEPSACEVVVVCSSLLGGRNFERLPSQVISAAAIARPVLSTTRPRTHAPLSSTSCTSGSLAGRRSTD